MAGQYRNARLRGKQMRKQLRNMNGDEARRHYTKVAERRWQRADDLYEILCEVPMSPATYNAIKELADEFNRKAKLYSEPDTRPNGWQARRALSNLEMYGMAAAVGWLCSCNWPIEDAERLLLDR